MKHTSLFQNFIFLLFGAILLAACSAAPTTTTLNLPISTTSIPAVVTAASSFSDPFAYCASVGTIDQPDERYTGPVMPEEVVKGLMVSSGASKDAPLEVFSQGSFWRCMDGQVYACFVGANLPCESKADTGQEPTPAMDDFCQSDPDAEFLPAAVTGHATIYQWSCQDGKAVAGEQVFEVDEQGYIRSIWYAVAP